MVCVNPAISAVLQIMDPNAFPAAIAAEPSKAAVVETRISGNVVPRLSFLFAGFCIVCGSVFQALGNGVYSMMVSIARQLIVLLPAAYLLSRLGNVDYVWWSFPIAEIASLTMTIIFMILINKKVICHIGEEKSLDRNDDF